MSLLTTYLVPSPGPSMDAMFVDRARELAMPVEALESWEEQLSILDAAVGIADYSRSVVVQSSGIYVGSNTPPLPNYGPAVDTRSETKNNMVIFGYSAGLGMDVALLDNVFVRAEWGYIQFKAPAHVNAYVNNLRVGGGLKF